MYVEFQRRNIKTHGQGLTTAAFIKDILSLIQSVNKLAAICYYDDSCKANSICHPSHISMDQEELEHYFPRTYTQQDKIIVKCCMTSSLSLT